MTDNDIIKALECCIKDNCDCGECPAIPVCQHDADCPKTIALALVNRQKAEIERLTTLAELGNMRANDYRAMRDKLKIADAEIERLKDYNEYLLSANTALSNEILDIKSEAIKEFAEKTHKMITEIYNKHIFGHYDLVAEEKDAIINFSDDVTSGFDNLVKEIIEKKGI